MAGRFCSRARGAVMAPALLIRVAQTDSNHFAQFDTHCRAAPGSHLVIVSGRHGSYR